MQQTFLEHLAGEAKGDIRQAMTLAGYSKVTPLKAVVLPLKQEIIDLAETMLAMNSMKAVLGLTGVLDNPGRLGSQHIVSASKEILDRVGVARKSDGGTVIKTDNLFILPPKDSAKIIETAYKTIDQAAESVIEIANE